MKILLLLFISILSCSANKKDLFGVYTSPNYNQFNRLRYGNYISDLKLELRSNYTYEFTTCSQTEKGKWEFDNEEIKLFCEEKKFVIGSINYIEKYKKGKICDSVQVFTYEKGKFQQNIKVQGKDYKLLLIKN